MTFGYWLKQFRRRTGLSSRAFSASIGMDSGNYCKLETDKMVPGTSTISRLADGLQLSNVEAALLYALASKQRALEAVQKELA